MYGENAEWWYQSVVKFRLVIESLLDGDRIQGFRQSSKSNLLSVLHLAHPFSNQIRGVFTIWPPIHKQYNLFKIRIFISPVSPLFPKQQEAELKPIKSIWVLINELDASSVSENCSVQNHVAQQQKSIETVKLGIQTPVSASIQKCSYLDERSYILSSAAFQTQTGKGLAPPRHVAGCAQCLHVVTTTCRARGKQSARNTAANSFLSNSPLTVALSQVVNLEN